MSTKHYLNTDHFFDKEIFDAGISNDVNRALTEDIGNEDITAALISSEKQAKARIIARENAIICGRPWCDAVFKQLDPAVEINWQVDEGSAVKANQLLVTLTGHARPLLTAERTALNFLQLMSGTASCSHYYAQIVADSKVKLLDTRKTLPGLRIAQKYAVKIGGCYNHRMGLFDAFLIKENHITACGGIAAAIANAREHAPDKPVEVEVEALEELKTALSANADIIMLDNFSLEALKQAVELTNGQAKLEASGGISDKTLRDIAATGVDYISLGTLTKHLQAIDLSMRIDM